MNYEGKSNSALKAIQQVNFSEMLYRGYWIKTNALNNSMWIERDGFCISRLNPTESWDAARWIIDQLS